MTYYQLMGLAAPLVGLLVALLAMKVSARMNPPRFVSDSQPSDDVRAGVRTEILAMRKSFR